MNANGGTLRHLFDRIFESIPPGDYVGACLTGRNVRQTPQARLSRGRADIKLVDETFKKELCDRESQTTNKAAGWLLYCKCYFVATILLQFCPSTIADLHV